MTLGQSLLGEKFVVVVVGVEGNFSVSFGPKPGFRLWLWFWPNASLKCSAWEGPRPGIISLV